MRLGYDLPTLVFLAGFAHLGILIASALVPFQLKWKTELAVLSTLHRQMYWTYAAYVVLAIVSFACISMLNADEIARGGGLARGFCLYVAAFWGGRVCLQGVFDVKEHLGAWWLKAGYHLLTVLFVCFAAFYGWLAVRPGG
jgi:hypothetical protein